MENQAAVWARSVELAATSAGGPMRVDLTLAITREK